MVIAGFMAGGLGRTETIALSSTLGVVLFFVLLGVATFCYRLVAVNACLRHNDRLPAKRYSGNAGSTGFAGLMDVYSNDAYSSQ